jgi:hypothetical protein
MEVIEEQQKGLSDSAHAKGKMIEQGLEQETNTNDSTFTHDNDNIEIGFVYLNNPNENKKTNDYTEESSTAHKTCPEDNTEDADETKSISSNDSRLNEHVNWRIATKAQRHKAWIKTSTLKGKTYKEKSQIFINTINEADIHWINVSRESHPDPKERGLYITLTFPDEQNLQAALECEFDSIDENKKVKMAQALIQKRKRTQPQGAIVKFWDIPFTVNRNDFINMAETKFGTIKSHKMFLNDKYQSCYVEFEDESIAEEILETKSQIVGNECLRVTPPEMTYKDLLQSKKETFAAKCVNIPRGMTSAELYNIMKQVGAQTCYMPINERGYRKGLAIVTFKSIDTLEAILGQGYKINDHYIKFLHADQKTCHTCHSPDHIRKDCPISKERRDRFQRKQTQFSSLRNAYKQYQPQAYTALNRRYGNHNRPSYAETAARGNGQNSRQNHSINNKNQQENNMNRNDRMLNMLENLNERLTRMEEELAKINSFDQQLASLTERVDWLHDREVERHEQNSENALGISSIQQYQYPTNPSSSEPPSNKRKHQEETTEPKRGDNDSRMEQLLSAIITRMDNFETELHKTKSYQQRQKSPFDNSNDQNQNNY